MPLPTILGFTYFIATLLSHLWGCSNPRGDLVPATKIVIGVVTVTVLGGIPGRCLFTIIKRVRPIGHSLVTLTGRTRLPGIVAGIQAVGNHQFRQP